MFRKRHSVAIAVAVLLLVVAVAGVAFAGSANAKKPNYANLHKDFIAKFAANLGVEEARVTEALDTTKKQILDEAVARGDLTREQADKMAARKMGESGFGGKDFKKQRPDSQGGKLGFMGKDAENILGMTPEQIREELKSGKKMEEILADHGMTVEQFHQKMLESKKEALNKALADGKITQDQYDRMIKRMEQRK